MSTALDFFDDISEGGSSNANERPIWSIDLDDPSNEKKIHNWLIAEMNHLKELNRDRFQTITRDLARYKGMQYQAQETREGRERQDGKSSVEKIVTNQIYDLVQNSSSRLLKYRPAVAILPTNDEFDDRIGSQMTDAWLKHIWYCERFDGLTQPLFVKAAKVMGEAYLFIEWDPEKGDLDAEYKAKYHDKVSKGEKVPLLNANGQPELDENGKEILVESPVYNGDVSYRFVYTTDVLCDRRPLWNDVGHIFRREVTTPELARLQYPKGAHNIKDNRDVIVFDYEKLEARKARNEVVLWHFYLKRQKGCDKGRYIVFTADGIVSNKIFPYSHRKLPCTRFTDLDLPGELHGVSGIRLIKGLTGARNNLTNMMLRNAMLCGHPKWFAPAGSVDKAALGNDTGIAWFKGPVPPQLATFNTIGNEFFALRDDLKEEARQVYGLSGVSAGEPPPGIKAGVALQFLSEQENERFNEPVLKFSEWVKETAIMTIEVAGDYYEDDEKRQIRILGKNNAWMTTFFKAQHLTKDYDIRVQNSSALPQSKAARTQTLLDLKKEMPDLISNEQFADMLELAQDQKFLDIATVSIRAAEAEVQELLEGKEVKDPEEFEDHVAHWKVKVRALREWSFKHRTPEKIQERLKGVIMAHEMIMWERAKHDQVLAQQLNTLSGFPVLYHPEGLDDPAQVEPAPAPGMPPGMAPDAGLPVEGAFQDPQMPVDPGQGEAQAVTNPQVPSMDALMGSAPPIEPTGAI